MSDKKAVPGKDGNKYIPFEQRSGEKSVVYFTRDLSPEGLLKIYDRVSKGMEGKIAVKLHTGEQHGRKNVCNLLTIGIVQQFSVGPCIDNLIHDTEEEVARRHNEQALLPAQRLPRPLRSPRTALRTLRISRRTQPPLLPSASVSLHLPRSRVRGR